MIHGIEQYIQLQGFVSSNDATAAACNEVALRPAIEESFCGKHDVCFNKTPVDVLTAGMTRSDIACK